MRPVSKKSSQPTSRTKVQPVSGSSTLGMGVGAAKRCSRSARASASRASKLACGAASLTSGQVASGLRARHSHIAILPSSSSIFGRSSSLRARESSSASSASLSTMEWYCAVRSA